MRCYLFHSAVLIDRPRLAEQLPAAWAKALSEHHGRQIDTWQNAYHRVVEDWDSYWADLSLNESDSLAQWREGRWRIIRAMYRLADQPLPPLDTISTHLDELPYRVGYYCSAWQPGVDDMLRSVTRQDHKAAIISPYIETPRVQGMLEASTLDRYVAEIIGPDELGQVGLTGINWLWLAARIGFEVDTCRLVSDEAIPDADVISPPADLTSLVRMLE